jgi:hypothetical protein
MIFHPFISIFAYIILFLTFSCVFLECGFKGMYRSMNYLKGMSCSCSCNNRHNQARMDQKHFIIDKKYDDKKHYHLSSWFTS